MLEQLEMDKIYKLFTVQILSEVTVQLFFKSALGFMQLWNLIFTVIGLKLLIFKASLCFLSKSEPSSWMFMVKFVFFCKFLGPWSKSLPPRWNRIALKILQSIRYYATVCFNSEQNIKSQVLIKYQTILQKQFFFCSYTWTFVIIYTQVVYLSSNLVSSVVYVQCW